jgi:hypothetical protein
MIYIDRVSRRMGYDQVMDEDFSMNRWIDIQPDCTTGNYKERDDWPRG